MIQFKEGSSVQSLSHVWVFGTPWTTACQASLSITNSWSPHKPMSVELVMPSNHLILYCPLLLCPQSFPASGSFPVSQLFTSDGQSIGASVFASVLLKSIQGWFPCRPRDSQESSPPPQLEKNQFFDTQPSLWSNSLICTWLLEKQ